MRLFRTRAAILAGLLASTAALQAQGDTVTDPGAYLAARNAAGASDFAEAATYYGQALAADPQNPALLENAIIAQVALGRFDLATPLAASMRDAGLESQLANMVLITDAALRSDWIEVVADFEGGKTVSPLFDGLVQAWAAVGLGNMTDALADFDMVIETEGMAAYGLYHKAMALASVGDYEGADAILADPGPGATAFSPRAAIAHAQILSQLGRDEDAVTVLSAVFGDTLDPGIVDLQRRLADGETVPFEVVTNPKQGVSEVAFMIASLLATEAREDYTLQYARMAQALSPGNIDAVMLTAGLLQTMQRYDLASDVYAQVPQDDPSFISAEMGRVDTLRRSGREEAAVEVAQGLARSAPDLPFVQQKLADVLRDSGDLEGAFTAYGVALDLYPESDPSRWVVYYTRAIVAHQLDDWPQAEADFRAALALQPEQPQILNYLGYSLVERGEKLDEALGMIEKAVEGQPENGAIVDSLGWVYFELGRYRDAVDPLERAAALEATDPTVNDHLGDAYWAVGREREARFQWQRALSFDPDDTLATRIRAKLADGLDAVRAAEGAAPIQLTDEPAQ